MSTLHDLGVIGLGVMGASLARNAAGKGFRVAVWNRTHAKAEAFIAAAPEDDLQAYDELSDFVASLATPRRILIMVKAGPAVDAVAESLAPFLDEGDILIDGGNTLFADTQRRFDAWAARGIHWVGMGVSGGEQGALHGPSMMPGGEQSVWAHLQPMLSAMAADDFDGGKCVDYLGVGGAGHYVKMVHNGIEYAIMQLLAESYALLRDGYRLPADAIDAHFATWTKGDLSGYLTEISQTILQQQDDQPGHTGALLDQVLDTAGQKGTGRWTVIDGLKRGVDVSLIHAAVAARVRSSAKDARVRRAAGFMREHRPTVSLAQLTAIMPHALRAAVALCYAEGLQLIAVASEEENWHINLATVCRIWQGGCIIRAELLKPLMHHVEAHPGVAAFDLPYVQTLLRDGEKPLRHVTAALAQMGLASPCWSAAKNKLIGMTTARSSANFIQGLRDCFGAHTYKRIDMDGTFHSQWGA